MIRTSSPTLTRTLGLTLTACLAVGPAGTSIAATILVDLSTAQSPSAPAGDGKYWNSLGLGASDASIADLVDSSNSFTGISLDVDVANVNAGGISGAGFGGTGINGPSGGDPFDESSVVIDGIFANNNSNGTAVITLDGLLASTDYDLSAIGGRASNGKDGTINIVTGTSSSSSYSLLNNGTVLDFTVTSSAAGLIEFEFRKTESGDSGGATFNGLSITGDFVAIPEPASAMLVGLGGLCLLGRRRRID